jgi:hypothetical protein
MGIILTAIQDNFGTEESFTSWDIHKLTKIDLKVVQMNLKKMHNKEVLYFNQSCDIFRLRSDQEIYEARKRENDRIDQYSLKQPKYKL